MILPNIIPTKGTKIVSLNFKRDRIVINNNVPRKETITAIAVLTTLRPLGKIASPLKSLNLALSMVPAVVGETNRFRLSCCITKPQILKDAPAIKILIKTRHSTDEKYLPLITFKIQ